MAMVVSGMYSGHVQGATLLDGSATALSSCSGVVQGGGGEDGEDGRVGGVGDGGEVGDGMCRVGV